MSDLKLYTMPGACSLADHIALRWAGAAFDVVTLDYAATKAPDFLALNPAGAVPVLQQGDWVLTQNVAILNYLADTYPAAQLGGDGSARSRAEVNRWLSFLNADVHPAFRPLFGATDGLEDAAADVLKTAAKTRLRGYFERLDAQLADKDWLTGTRSMADAYLFVVTRWAKGLHVDLSGLPHLDALFTRMLDDAGVNAAMQAEGLA